MEAKRKTGGKALDINFIDRIITSSATMSVICGVVFFLYGSKLPVKFGMGFAVGAAAGVLNFAFLKGLIRAVFHKKGPQGLAAGLYGLALVAVLAAYLAGVYYRIGNAPASMLGFSVPIILAVIMGLAFALKGGAAMDPDDGKAEPR